MRKRNRAALAPLVLLAVSGCPSPEEAPPETAAVPVESRAAGIRIAALPAIFEVSSDDADALRLAAPSLPAPSRVTITMSDEYPQGLNIVDAVEQEMSNFEAAPEGRSFGQTQLMAPIGLTYMARGRYREEGVEIEQLRAMLAHPWGNRLLTIAYTYPAGTDTSERGAQLMELLGEMEAMEEAAGE